jgi:hypothetical protein
MATMCAALLNQELGFTICILEPVQSNPSEGNDKGQAQGSPNETLSQMTVESTDQTVKGAANKPGVLVLGYPTCCQQLAAHCFLTDDFHATLAHSSDDQQAQRSPDRGQAVGGVAIDSNKPGRCKYC